MTGRVLISFHSFERGASIPLKVIRTVAEMTAFTAGLHADQRRLGLVPTMGYLHEGHLCLVKLLDGECEVKAASIFVNPIQFGPNEDFFRYPRNEERDLELLRSAGCEVVFSPEAGEIYAPGFQTFVEVEELQKPLCGQYRPGHFRGVATIILKLFNITGCDAAAFGLKDFQQAMVIRRMVSDLNLPVKLLFGEIFREDDGLAMSSRNVYLSPEERIAALAVSRSLRNCRAAFNAGERQVLALAALVENELKNEPGVRIEYVDIVDSETLAPVQRIERPARAAVAVFVGKTRLIDNVELW